MPARRWPSDTSTRFGVDRSRQRATGGGIVSQPDSAALVADLTLDAPAAAATGAGVAPGLELVFAVPAAVSTGAGASPSLSESLGVPAAGGAGGAPAPGVALALEAPAAAGSAVAVAPALTLDEPVGPAPTPTPGLTGGGFTSTGEVWRRFGALDLTAPAATVRVVAVPPGLTIEEPAPEPQPIIRRERPRKRQPVRKAAEPRREPVRETLRLSVPSVGVRAVAVAPVLKVDERARHEEEFAVAALLLSSA